jgi:acyl-CoA hydrolase
MPEITQRSVQDSLVEMTEIVLPEDANSHGSIFGGRVLALVDKCAAIVAMRHARSLVLTVSVDSVAFLNPVRVGHVMILEGRLNAVFGSSMEVEVLVFAEDPLSGRRSMTTRAFVTMVSIGADDRPKPAPKLISANDDERQRATQAAERRKARLTLRAG